MNKEYKIAIIGLGYVGLPLALSFSEHFSVVGFDVKLDRVDSLNRLEDLNKEIVLTKNKKLSFTNNINHISDANVYVVTVPTPVTDDNVPDLTMLKRASKMLASLLRQDDIVIYESTVYPGVTEEVCVPILEEESQLIYNKNFYCGYSPERISPGANQYKLEDIVKITSGSNDKVSEEIDMLYSKVIKAGTYKAPSIKIAEAAKVVENIQRDVNIALINELAMMFDKMNISTSEVLAAAKTKWNFLDFKAGLVGGHCIGVDPYYLLHKSEEIGYTPNLLYSSRKINNSVAQFVVNKTVSLLVKFKKKIEDARILILGYTFKENCSDMRNTKVKDIVDGLRELSFKVNIFDPYIPPSASNNFISFPFEMNQKYDAIIVAVSHNQFLEYSIDNFYKISNGKLVLLDIKGIYKESTWKL